MQLRKFGNQSQFDSRVNASRKVRFSVKVRVSNGYTVNLVTVIKEIDIDKMNGKYQQQRRCKNKSFIILSFIHLRFSPTKFYFGVQRYKRFSNAAIANCWYFEKINKQASFRAKSRNLVQNATGFSK